MVRKAALTGEIEAAVSPVYSAVAKAALRVFQKWRGDKSWTAISADMPDGIVLTSSYLIMSDPALSVRKRIFNRYKKDNPPAPLDQYEAFVNKKDFDMTEGKVGPDGQAVVDSSAAAGFLETGMRMRSNISNASNASNATLPPPPLANVSKGVSHTAQVFVPPAAEVIVQAPIVVGFRLVIKQINDINIVEGYFGGVFYWKLVWTDQRLYYEGWEIKGVSHRTFLVVKPDDIWTPDFQPLTGTSVCPEQLFALDCPP